VVKEFLRKAASQGADYFTGNNVFIDIGCSSPAVVPLLKIE